MIYCVWYPSGGFGHFINAILSLYGENFVRPKNSLKFSKNGNSHSLDLVVPKYLHECWNSGTEFKEDKNYAVLIDNGIDNESKNFKSVFPGAKIIKICYTDNSWPIVARTLIDKAMGSNILSELSATSWNSTEPWAQREKYFLYLRDHPFRLKWKSDTQNEHAIFIEDMCNYSTLFSNFADHFIKISNFKNTWLEWRAANNRYISPVETAQTIIKDIKNKKSYNLIHIEDLWDQAIVYYFIYLEFGFEVPHNEYSNWFTTTDDIVKMLEDHGVCIDSN